jgi:predicted nucleotidyltransferase/uncharacterized protein (UPF0332 family)
MNFKIEKTANPNFQKYRKEDIELAYKFAEEVYKEFGDFLKSIVLFGSRARGRGSSKGDIDILLIVDDLSIALTGEVIEAYRIILGKITVELSKRLHITTLKLTHFWDFVKAGDPVGVNILRDGVPLLDVGFFEPLQVLLRRGRVRPSTEAIMNYYTRAPVTLSNAKWHILQGALDLYWAVIDSAHAALMTIGEIPPAPNQVGSMLNSKLISKKIIESKYGSTVDKFYNLSKKITHREIKDISGKQFDDLSKEASAFVERMRIFIEKRK